MAFDMNIPLNLLLRAAHAERRACFPRWSETKERASRHSTEMGGSQIGAQKLLHKCDAKILQQNINAGLKKPHANSKIRALHRHWFFWIDSKEWIGLPLNFPAAFRSLHLRDSLARRVRFQSKNRGHQLSFGNESRFLPRRRGAEIHRSACEILFHGFDLRHGPGLELP
jgi:hypothetical protein